MFWFLLIALVVVVTGVTLAVVGGGEQAVLPEAEPERIADGLPPARPVARADIEALRLPVAARGYRMAEVDDVLARLGAELAERDARIADLEAALAGAQATAVGGPDLFKRNAGGDPGHGGAPGPYGRDTGRDADPGHEGGTGGTGPQGEERR
ncbi:DivIVA domain-containing protein [Streptomyces sp. NRRL S-87]|uniref:DivIVA domain-containing protein n=1 Tax=Streptomyces sp. NRRL S-87 TaxID=1463920 RepID=UPI000564DFBB|nr:DivIVA domain-containing protein [Streptomyces sp. NRRL S-87]